MSEIAEITEPRVKGTELTRIEFFQELIRQDPDTSGPEGKFSLLSYEDNEPVSVNEEAVLAWAQDQLIRKQPSHAEGRLRKIGALFHRITRPGRAKRAEERIERDDITNYVELNPKTGLVLRRDLMPPAFIKRSMAVSGQPYKK